MTPLLVALVPIALGFAMGATVKMVRLSRAPWGGFAAAFAVIAVCFMLVGVASQTANLDPRDAFTLGVGTLGLTLFSWTIGASVVARHHLRTYRTPDAR